jgi:glycine cleavage system H protein
MTEIPEGLRYHPQHHWVRQIGEEVTVGITEFARAELGEVVYVGLPTLGAVASQNEALCELESNKTVADVYAPIAGEVIAVNSSLSEDPAPINDDPYGAGWLFRLRPSDANQMGAAPSE